MTSQWRHQNKTHSFYSEWNSLQNLYFGFFCIWKISEFMPTCQGCSFFETQCITLYNCLSLIHSWLIVYCVYRSGTVDGPAPYIGREAWFIATLIGAIGSLVWLAVCIIGIFIYRRCRRCGRFYKADNMAGRPSYYLSYDITTAQVNSALHPSWVAKSSNTFGWGKGGKVIGTGWQVRK